MTYFHGTHTEVIIHTAIDSSKKKKIRMSCSNIMIFLFSVTFTAKKNCFLYHFSRSDIHHHLMSPRKITKQRSKFDKTKTIAAFPQKCRCLIRFLRMVDFFYVGILLLDTYFAPTHAKILEKAINLFRGPHPN